MVGVSWSKRREGVYKGGKGVEYSSSSKGGKGNGRGKCLLEREEGSFLIRVRVFE